MNYRNYLIVGKHICHILLGKKAGSKNAKGNSCLCAYKCIFMYNKHLLDTLKCYIILSKTVSTSDFLLSTSLCFLIISVIKCFPFISRKISVLQNDPK